jgi:hypothetical protein
MGKQEKQSGQAAPGPLQEYIDVLLRTMRRPGVPAPSNVIDVQAYGYEAVSIACGMDVHTREGVVKIGIADQTVATLTPQEARSMARGLNEAAADADKGAAMARAGKTDADIIAALNGPTVEVFVEGEAFTLADFARRPMPERLKAALDRAFAQDDGRDGARQERGTGARRGPHRASPLAPDVPPEM